MTAADTHGAGIHETLLPPTVERRRRRRRPSGAAPPLPRSIGRTGKGMFAASVGLLVWLIVVGQSQWGRNVTDRIDADILRQIARVRTGWVTTAAARIHLTGSGWLVSILAGELVVLLIAFRRWRHLFTFLGSVAVLEFLGNGIYETFARPRPLDVTIIGRWGGYSMPAAPVAVITIIGVGYVYAVAVAGRPRRMAKLVVGLRAREGTIRALRR